MDSKNISTKELCAAATQAVQAMLANANDERSLNFLEFCLAVEIALNLLADKDIFCLDFSLAFDDNKLTFEALKVVTAKPDGFDLSDFRKTIVAVCAPKAFHTGITGSSTLVVRRAIFSFGNDPTVQYRIKQNAEAEQGKSRRAGAD